MKKRISAPSVEDIGILFANEGAPIKADNGSNSKHGELLFANEARFTEGHFSEPLTTYATGWRDPENIEATLNFLAPVVPVGRRFEFGQASNAEEFYSEVDDVRGIGADFKRVEFTSSKVQAKTLNKGLTVRVDLDNVGDMTNWREVYTGKLMRRIFRNELRRAVTLLAAAATNTAKTWDTTAGKDPDQDIQTEVIAYQDAAGVNPTRLIYGMTAWNKRRLSHRAQNTAGGFASAGLAVQDVADQCGVQRGLVSKERYQSAAAAKTKVVGDIALLFLAEDGQTPEDPSNIKRFVSSVEGGGRVRVYEQQISAKLFDITVEHYSNVIVTSTLGIRKLTIS